jgi:glycolate oxidase
LALEKDIHVAFAGVVGEENLCDDPVMMPSYFNTAHAAVIMPKNTAEVQAVVRLCNKFKLKYRPFCTGWTGFFPPGIVLLDLRRMDQIIEINEKNMYAVVEPYVTSAQLRRSCSSAVSTPILRGPGRSARPCCAATATWISPWARTTGTISPSNG